MIVELAITLTVDADVLLNVYDLLGHNICTLINKKEVAGNYNISWDGRDANNNPVSSGIYIYHFKINNRFSFSNKMALIK